MEGCGLQFAIGWTREPQQGYDKCHIHKGCSMTTQNNNNIAIPRFSRRTLLASIPALGLLPGVLSAQNAPAISVKKLNCFEIRVSDPARTIAFYQDLFGMPVQARFGERAYLRVGEGPHFMVVRPLESGETPAITYIGYSVEDFDVETQQAALLTKGFKEIDPPSITAPGIESVMSTWVRMRGETPELYFSDARGLIVQLSDDENCGGTGSLGSVCDTVESAPAGIFKLDDISHFTAFVSDGVAGNLFYQDLFGLKVQTHQGPNGPVTGIGDGKQFVRYAGGGGPGGGAPGGAPTPANIHHGCFNMTEGFVVDDVLAKLTEYGLQARGDQKIGPLMHYVSLRQPDRGGAVGGTPELYFTDPDGILMQLQDISYCGGGGYLGNECTVG
jgi:catechol 2,3-dioxygenase-like lactoylglutathione lyase family enzyme